MTLFFQGIHEVNYFHNKTEALFALLPCGMCTDGEEAVVGKPWYRSMNQGSGTKLDESSLFFTAKHTC